MHTIASFLREKATNMAKWLSSSGYPSPIQLPQLSDLALVAIAQTLRETYVQAISDRDFGALLAGNLPDELVCVVKFVQKEEELQDKFWRYLSLFSDTVSG